MGVDLVLAGVLRGAAVRGLEDGELVAEVGAGREAEAADQAGAQVADDVAEHVLGDEHGVVLRVLEHPHADRVDVRLVGPDPRRGSYSLAILRKTRVIRPPVSRSTLGFSTSVTRLRPVFFAYSNAWRQMFVQPCTLTMRVESATLSRPLSFHGFILGLAHSAV